MNATTVANPPPVHYYGEDESVHQPPFEGVEKRLIVEVNPNVCNPYSMTKQEWKGILDKTNCEIVSVKELDDHRVYLLSESTLTVWPTGFLLKTCGRTTPLLGISTFLENLNLSAKDAISWLVYSRLDFLHPLYQIWPHQNFTQELEFVKEKLFEDAQQCQIQLDGQAFYAIFASSDQLPKHPMPSGYHSEEILMTKIPTDCVETFTGTSELAASHPEFIPPQNGSEIKRFIDNSANTAAVVDEFWFQPCGYSANALLRTTEDTISYFSCHVSPEPATSYASLEVGWRSEPQQHISADSHSNTGFALHEMMATFSPLNAFRTQVKVTSVLEQDTKTTQKAPVEGVTFDSNGVQCTINFQRLPTRLPFSTEASVEKVLLEGQNSSCSTTDEDYSYQSTDGTTSPQCIDSQQSSPGIWDDEISIVG